MQREGYKASTIGPSVRALKAVSRRTDLLNPEHVKGYLVRANLSENRKEKVTDDLTRFYKHFGIPFDKPRYKRVDKLPFKPLETEVDSLISGLSKETATFMQLLRETGPRERIN